MTRPVIPVNLPKDSDPIGEGAERIRETRQAIYDIFPIKKSDLEPGITPDGSVSKEYVDEQDKLLQDQIDSNKEDIGANSENIAGNAMEISTNADNILTNTGDVADLDVRVTKNEGDIEALELETKSYRLETDANLRGTPQIQLVDENDSFSDVAMIAGSGMNIVSGPSSMTFTATGSGVELDNESPWTYSQYNTLINASISNNGTPLPRALLGDIQAYPNQKISPSSGGEFTVCNVFGDAPTKVGIYANLLLDPIAQYTFDVNNFVVNDIDESKWLYVRLLSESGESDTPRWKQIGANFLGESGGLGGGTDVYTEHLNASVEDTTIVSTNNALSAGPVQLDNVVTVESGATWVIV